MNALRSLAFAIVLAPAAVAEPLYLKDLEGTWRLSAVSYARYGCDNPGALTVVFKADGQGGLTGDYSSPSLPKTYRQDFVEHASLASASEEHFAAGRAITLDAPAALRRNMIVETEAGPNGRPVKLEWMSKFGGLGDDEFSHFSLTQYQTRGWLTRCSS